MQPLLQWKSNNYYITYCDNVFVDLCIHHAMRMCCTVISGRPGPTRPDPARPGPTRPGPALRYFSTLSNKWQDLRKQLSNMKSVF
jgi:hypothetical protein